MYSTANRIAFKEDVRLTRASFTEEMCTLFEALLHTAPQMRDDTIVITSAHDGRHGDGSLHYVGLALDIRILGQRPGGITGSDQDVQMARAKLWAGRLKQYIGPGYDIVVERDHIHAEYDPT